MKNIFRIFGAIIWLCDIVHFFGFLPVKAGAYVSKPLELLIAFGVGLCLFVVQPEWFGTTIKSILDGFVKSLDGFMKWWLNKKENS